MKIEIRDELLASLIGEHHATTVTPEVLRAYVYSSPVASERKAKEDFISGFLFAQVVYS